MHSGGIASQSCRNGYEKGSRSFGATHQQKRRKEEGVGPEAMPEQHAVESEKSAMFDFWLSSTWANMMHHQPHLGWDQKWGETEKASYR
jgi:hypothetical protein